MIAELRAAATGIALEPRVRLYSFSRDAQMAHHFGMVYPEEAAGVATLSAGSYTLSESQDAATGSMRFSSAFPTCPTSTYDQSTRNASVGYLSGSAHSTPIRPTRRVPGTHLKARHVSRAHGCSWPISRPSADRRSHTSLAMPSTRRPVRSHADNPGNARRRTGRDDQHRHS